MKMYRIKFIREEKEILVEPGTRILEAERKAKLVPDAPCGGRGKCGKCRVKIEDHMVLACQTEIHSDLEVDTLSGCQEEEILTEGMQRPVAFRPDLKQKKVILKKPETGDNRSEWERLTEQLDVEKPVLPDTEIASKLYGCRKEAEEWYVICAGNKILDISREEKKICFAAFDIGTTTVVGYLMDALTGKQLALKSRMNPQTQYGADVIMRADHALEHGVEQLTGCIRNAVDEMLQELAEEAGRSTLDICQVSVVGNTCMHHLFLGISPASLVHAPYNPAISQGLTLNAEQYGLHIHRKGQLLMLPDIAGYVGADTCGCILTLRQDQQNEISLMIDIGTNGEMVLGNKTRLACCSTAAGPAFEGAKIECGMRGGAGAVDHVVYKDGKWEYTTIGNKAPAGLCGSGLIDLVAQLYLAGFIDESGHLESGQEKAGVFVLVPPEKSGNDRGVYLTQKDIGEVQLAKAAIAAGIFLLMKRLEITEKDIKQVYLAGAFGNYMNPESAAAIGMFPAELLPRIQPVGNAAGEGARIALLNEEERKEMDRTVKNMDFVELAASPEFQDCFVDGLCFP